MVRTIYGFYEEPLLFSCESLTGALFLVLRLQGEDGVWLLSGISEKRLIALEKNELEIRTLYLNPESGFLLESREFSIYEVTPIKLIA